MDGDVDGDADLDGDAATTRGTIVKGHTFM